MTVNSSITFTNNFAQLITNALTLIGVAGAEDTISASDMSFSGQILNGLIKAWEAEGIGLWSLEEAVLFIGNTGQQKYQIGGSSADHCTSSFISTTVATAAIATATTLVLATVTGMTVGDKIGTVTLGTSTEWTTITAINTGTNTVTLNTALVNAAPVGTTVYTYTTDLQRPYDITQLRYRLYSNIDRVLESKSRNEYMSYGNKTITSTPVMYYYDVQLSSASLWIYPCPTNNLDMITFTYRRTLADMLASKDNMDLPQEWVLALTYNLAALVCPAYGKEAKLTQSIGPMADKLKSAAKLFDISSSSMHFVPDRH